MTDPEYRFLKGVGWVPATECKYLLMARDAKVWVFDRPPKKGEHGVTYSVTEKDWWDGVGLKPEGPQSYLRTVFIRTWKPSQEDWTWGDNYNPDYHRVMTVIIADE